MKFAVVLFCLTFVACSSFRVSGDEKSLILQQKRATEKTSNTRQLIIGLAKKLQNLGKQSREAVRNFKEGVKDEFKLYVEKIQADIQRARRRISEAIRKATEKIIDNVGETIKTCIESHREEAESLFEETYAKSRACADGSVKEVNDMIDNLTAESNTALDYSKNLLEGMKNCSLNDNGSISNVDQCLSPFTNEAQNIGVTITANTGISIGRINMAISELPAALDICAGYKMIRATMDAGKIILDVGRCSAKSFFV